MIVYENTKQPDIHEFSQGLSPVELAEVERELDDISGQIKSGSAPQAQQSFTDAIIGRDYTLQCSQQRDYKGSYVRLKASLARSPIII